ncbi:MAG TPA: YraN family protein [Taishania sp.]|nr:YraN family protein [Taishania sp.]HNS41324.1 YraN family protein [Taishania sp.]
MTHIELGQHGEEMAVSYLRNNDYEIIERNFRFKKLEIDIVALKNGQLIVCEVKTRVTAEIGEPFLAVTKSKQKQIIKATNHFLISRNLNINVQFDIISIVHNSIRTKIEHIENAFFPLL